MAIDLSKGLMAASNLTALDKAQQQFVATRPWDPFGARKSAEERRAAGGELQYQTALARQGEERIAGAERTALGASKAISLMGGITADPGEAYQAGQDAIDMAAGGVDPLAAFAGQTQQGQALLAQQQADAGVGRDQAQANLLKTQLANQESQYQNAERQVGRYGTGLDRTEYTALQSTMVRGQRTLDITNFISDIVSSTTPAQLASPGMAVERGRMQASKFPMYMAVQSLTEERKSVLRGEEREAIDSFLGNPDSFWSSLMSFDAATVSKFNTIGQWTRDQMEANIVGLDVTTKSLLDAAVNQDPAFYGFSAPDNATIRDAEGSTLRSPFEGAGDEPARLGRGLMDMLPRGR